jgi:high-affinity iron transporter
MGFWLHRKTEIGRWRSFIEDMAKSAVTGKSLLGLWVIAFMAVFREAFEIVLFMRALLLESGPQAQLPMILGILSSLILVFILATALLKFSAKVPIRQLFDVSSLLMVFLAFTLIGKALHSFQESGLLSVTEFPIPVRIDLLGVYPTYETFVPQMITLILSLSFWFYGRKSPRLPQTAASR